MPSQRSAYRDYKRASHGIFDSIAVERDISDADVYRYLGLYARFERCAELRCAYRDTYIESEVRDNGHELAILECRRRVDECEAVLWKIFSRAEADISGGDPTACCGTERPADASPPKPSQGRKRRSRARPQRLAPPPVAQRAADAETSALLMRTRMQDISKFSGEMLRKVVESCEKNRLRFDNRTKLEIALEFTIIYYKLRERDTPQRKRLCRHILDHPLPSIMMLDIGLRVVREELPFHRMTDAIASLITDYDNSSPEDVRRLNIFVMFLAVESICRVEATGGALYKYIMRSLASLETKPGVNIRASIEDILRG